MSVESAKQLVAKLQKNPQLRQQFQKAGEEAFQRVAKQQGHDVTASELHQALQEVSVSQLGSLRQQLPGGGTSIVAIASVAVI